MNEPHRRLLVVDDHTLVREALTLVLRALGPHWEFLEAGSVGEAERVLGSSPVELVLLDLHLPDAPPDTGFQRVRAAAGEGTPIVVLSGDVETHVIRRLLDAGARGYIAKSSTKDVTLSAIELVLRGGVYIPSEALGIAPRQSHELTARQREVLTLLAAGNTNKEIATLLGSSESTIRSHLAAVFRHLGVQNRAQAVRVAIERNLA